MIGCSLGPGSCVIIVQTAPILYYRYCCLAFGILWIEELHHDQGKIIQRGSPPTPEVGHIKLIGMTLAGFYHLVGP
jgi:hypothetical protein